MSDSMIEQSAARLFSGNVDKTLLESVESGHFPSELWMLASGSGFPIALAAEESGGIGETWSGAYPILRGLGYWQVPLPLAETMIGHLLLSTAGIDLPDGPLAVIEQGLDNDLKTADHGGRTSLSGTADRVAWARHCHHALVALNGDEIALVDLKQAGLERASGVAITHHLNHAKLPSDTINFEKAAILAQAPNPFPALQRPILSFGALARSIMIVGALEWLLEQSVQYANDRVQFGRPIGKYQAIQQQLALLAGDVVAARMAALVAANDAPSTQQRDCTHAVFSIAAAKIRGGEAASRGTSIAHQVHGAIGFTYEHALHFTTRRLWAWREEFGADAWWADHLGNAVIAAGKHGFWPAITDRRFEPGIALA